VLAGRQPRGRSPNLSLAGRYTPVSVRAVAAVPAAPLLLPRVSPRQPEPSRDAVAALRADVAALLAALPRVATIVLLAAGDDATVADGGCVDLAGSGHPQVTLDVPVDRSLLAAIATRTSAPRIRADRLQGDLAILAALIDATGAGTSIVPMTVARNAGVATLGGAASGVASAVAATGRDVAVLAAGDLSATRELTSPGYLVEGATAFDDAVHAAVRSGDRATLEALGPAEATRVAARGWAPLVVLGRVARAAGLTVAQTSLVAPRGVGQLLASSEAWSRGTP
jgi:hypothetical protein